MSTEGSVSLEVTESLQNSQKNREAKNKFTFFSQIIVIYAIIATAIFHLSF